jgi:hypothetical protein
MQLSGFMISPENDSLGWMFLCCYTKGHGVSLISINKKQLR